MAINFPSSPTEGQKFTSGLVVYTFSGGVWNAALLETALPFNYIVNPSFQISQENAGNLLATPAGLFPADQWSIQTPLSSEVSVQRRLASAAPASPNGSPYIIRMTVITPATGGTNTRYFGLVQYIEGQRIAANRFGTAGALPMVLRFWARHPSSAGFWGGGIRNGDATRGFAYSYTIQPSQVSQWAEIVIPIPGDTTGTWAKDNTSGLHVWFTITNNYASLSSVSGMWASGNIIAPIGLYEGTSSAGFTYDLTDFGLYLDPLNTGRAPPWQALDEHTAMVESCRYWYRMENGRGAVGSATLVGRMGAIHPVTMRLPVTYALVSPVTLHDIGTNNALTSLSTQYSSPAHAEFECNGTGMTAGRAVLMLTDGAGYVAVNARM